MPFSRLSEPGLNTLVEGVCGYLFIFCPAVTGILPDTSFSRRVQRSVADIIEGDEVTLFRVE